MKATPYNINYPHHAHSPSLQTDIELAKAMQEGSREALNRLLDRHLGSVYRYVLRRLGPGAEQQAGEIATSVFQEAFAKIGPYARGSATLPMRSWLLRLANRRLSRSAGMSPTQANGLSPAEQLAVEVRALAPKQAAVAALCLFEMLPPHEIAAALGVSTSRAMGLLRGALKRLGRAAPLEESDPIG